MLGAGIGEDYFGEGVTKLSSRLEQKRVAMKRRRRLLSGVTVHGLSSGRCIVACELVCRERLGFVG